MKIKIGERVGYRSLKTDTEFRHTGVVTAIFPNGIPSCRKPMLKIAGYSGVMLASNCEAIRQKKAGPRP